MITGYIERNQAVLPVTFQLTDGAVTIDFVIDTGFAGELTLPAEAIAALRLQYDREIVATLADDSDTILAVHLAVIQWHGATREVRVLATGVRPLLGTALLAGNELVTQFVAGGLVTVEAV